jgi:single-strand DNA-binding protein
MNKVVLIGRLTKDPELKYTPGNGTAVTTLSLAVNRRFSRDGQREADFFNVVVWGKQAESTANYMSKGSLMGIHGRIENRSYDAKDGTKRYITEIIAEEVEFLGGSGNGGSRQNNAGNSNNNFGGNEPSFNQGSMNFDMDMTPVDDGDIPF